MVRLRGEIAEYTGRELRIQNSTGGERTVPTASVVRVEFDRSPDQVSGDEQFAAGDWQLALASYQRALAANREPRPWVRRQIQSQMIWCHRNLGQWIEAGNHFVQLMASDPATQYFDAIPLVWSDEKLPPEVIRQAGTWLAASEQPVAVLMGASLLIESPSRTEALEKLRGLLANPDPRVVWLAYAQLWHAGANNATGDQQRSFAGRIETSDESLRAGPYSILGQSLLATRPEEATIALMHVPIQFDRERTLSAEALVGTADALEKQHRQEQAVGLYREAAASYSETVAGKRARSTTSAARRAAASRDVRPLAGDFLDGLRGRRLYALAEKFCEGRLTGMELDERQRSDLVIELSRTLAEHALAVAPGKALPLWERAGEVARFYAAKYLQSPRLILVNLQGAARAIGGGRSGAIRCARGLPFAGDGRCPADLARRD